MHLYTFSSHALSFFSLLQALSLSLSRFTTHSLKHTEALSQRSYATLITLGQSNNLTSSILLFQCHSSPAQTDIQTESTLHYYNINILAEVLRCVSSLRQTKIKRFLQTKLSFGKAQEAEDKPKRKRQKGGDDEREGPGISHCFHPGQNQYSIAVLLNTKTVLILIKQCNNHIFFGNYNGTYRLNLTTHLAEVS